MADPAIALMKSRRRIARPRVRDRAEDINYSREFRPAKWGSRIKLHDSNCEARMSAMGHKRTLAPVRIMSALPPKADIGTQPCIAAAESGMFSLDNPGICIACGADADGCEPDARKYKCEACGERAVYGAEELLIMLA